MTQLDYDAEQGRFCATLSVSGDGMDPIAMRISGEVADMITLPVPVTRLQPASWPGPTISGWRGCASRGAGGGGA